MQYLKKMTTDLWLNVSPLDNRLFLSNSTNHYSHNLEKENNIEKNR